MNWNSILSHWKTTLGGILVAIPSLIVGAGFVLTSPEQHWLALAGGLGALLLGGAAADASKK